MLSSFRRASKSVFGTILLVVVGLMIVVGFALTDIQNVGLGSGFSSSTLAKVGSLEVTDQDISDAMQRRLAQVREQNPEAGYSAIAGDFDTLLESLIEQRAIEAFADKHGFVVSKRLVDAEIAKLPGVRGLDGRVSTQAYEAFLARQRMTDSQLRQLIAGSILQRLLLTPPAANPRVPIGMATPYASMLLEERQGEVLLLPVERFAQGLNPTDAQIQQFYAQNRNRYMIPEQRVLRIARLGPEQVAGIAASDQEITAFYNANQDQYGAKDLRTISQAIAQDRNVANAIAARARQGQAIAQAAAPAGANAAVTSLESQTRDQYADVAGDAAAAAVFGARQGSVVGPVQSDFGWVVAKVDSVRSQPGRSLAQVRSEIATRITAEKRQNALADLVDKVQDAIDGGANFEEAARAANLPVTRTPLITASGTARGDRSYKFPQELAPALRSGFELAPTDEPVIDQLPGEAGFVLVAPAEVVPAAPAPIASIRDQLRQDWIRQQALQRAKAAADAIAKRAGGNASLAEAARQAGASLPPVQPVRARRIQLSQAGQQVPAPLRVLFSTVQGKAQVGADPEGRGFFVVKVGRIVPGNALNQPRLITEVQSQFREPVAQEYALQLMAAAKQSVGVKRNESAIRAAKSRITSAQ